MTSVPVERSRRRLIMRGMEEATCTDTQRGQRSTLTGVKSLSAHNSSKKEHNSQFGAEMLHMSFWD